MLARLNVRDVVLIERLDLDWHEGLCAMTGETGAGKSIMLDALGLALGVRADRGLVRAGAQKAVATAAFEVETDHPAWAAVAEAGLAAGADDGALILRRQVSADGRSRAWINDEPVGVGVLSAVGDQLVEIHGQHDERGLLDARGHRRLLDAYGALEADRAACGDAWATWKAARETLAARKAEADRAAEEEEWLRHAVDDLASLAPQVGEEAALEARRKLMMGAERLAQGMEQARGALAGGGEHGDAQGFDAALAAALAQLERTLEQAPPPEAGSADPLASAREAAQALERAITEASEAGRLLEEAAADLDFDPAVLEEVDDRLFALKDAARKHRVEPDGLSGLLEDYRARLARVEKASQDVSELAESERVAREAYEFTARTLSQARQAAARRLDAAVARELPPLKLDQARFVTSVRPEGAQRGPAGHDQVEFQIATNPGANPGPLKKIASGGELARFILALKVCLAETGAASTLVFDEVDKGIGGAVADAVGLRLAKLSRQAQVLVVTHSPQVAARADHQWRIAKSGEAVTRTDVEPLDTHQRKEEIARMLSGAEITQEARMAADRLLAEAEVARV